MKGAAKPVFAYREAVRWPSLKQALCVQLYVLGGGCQQVAVKPSSRACCQQHAIATSRCVKSRANVSTTHHRLVGNYICSFYQSQVKINPFPVQEVVDLFKCLAVILDLLGPFSERDQRNLIFPELILVEGCIKIYGSVRSKTRCGASASPYASLRIKSSAAARNWSSTETEGRKTVEACRPMGLSQAIQGKKETRCTHEEGRIRSTRTPPLTEKKLCSVETPQNLRCFS